VETEPKATAPHLDSTQMTRSLFFAEAVAVAASQGVESINKMAQMAETDKASIAGLGRAASSAVQIHDALLERPITTAAWLSAKTGLTAATVNKTLSNLEKIGIIRQLNDSKRNRLLLSFCLRTIYGHTECLKGG